MNAASAAVKIELPVTAPEPSTSKFKSWGGLVNVFSFFIVHALAVYAIFWLGASPKALVLCAASFILRKFGITAGYHRYLAHRAFKTGRFFQFLLAWLGCAATQKGPLWWAGHHRAHHQNSDQAADLHSPLREGFWWSHIGWILDTEYDKTDHAIIPDFSRYPEMRWLNNHFLVPPILWGAFCLAVGGWTGLLWGFFVSTTILWHTTFLINSACHLMGRRRFATRDGSRNSLVLAILTMGEGWHNNHHYYPSSVNQGFYWWEIDVTFYILKFLSRLGVVWDLRLPPRRVLELGRREDAASSAPRHGPIW